MNAEERREAVLACLKNSAQPVSGAALAKAFRVSRQIIVQDIALLRTAGSKILSTHKGYLYSLPKCVSRVFCVRHSDGQILDELNTVVDCGGRVEDVFVEHEVYGRLSAGLHIGSRRAAQEFMKQVENGASPLKNLTSGIHFHTVSADSEQVLDEIERELAEKAYLVM